MQINVDTDEAAESHAAGGRRRLAIALGLLLAVAVTAAIVLGTRSPPPRRAADAGSLTGVATVRRRNLVQTDTEPGTLSFAGSHTVYDRLSGTITRLPRIGALIRRGQALYEVNERPVILLYGPSPAYRALRSGDRDGRDIGELNANLIALGYGSYGIVEDDSWQTATTDAVKAWQKALGERQTGRLALGRVVFLPGEQLVNAIAGTLGSSVSEQGRAVPRTELVDLTSTETTSATSTAATTTARSSVASAVTQTASTTSTTSTAAAGRRRGGGKSSNESAGGGSGGSGAAAAAILQTSSTRLVATVDLPASAQSEAVRGSRVTVEMPNGSVLGGRIASVSAVATTQGAGNGGATGGPSGAGRSEGGESSSPPTVPVTIRLPRRVKGAGLDRAAVSVKFAQAKARHVLSVPVTALVATAGDAYAVQEAVAPHRLLPVSTGLFAAGYVQISGAGIRPGLKVTDSQG